MLRIVEQKDANSSELAVHEVNTSVYVFDAKLLAEAIANLKSNNAQGEFYLTDALETAKANGAVGAFAAPDPLSVEGVNDRVQLAALAKAHNKRICEHWMRKGVTILDSETTWIEDDVRIERDAVILPGCFLEGQTVIGEARRSAHTQHLSARSSMPTPMWSVPACRKPTSVARPTSVRGRTCVRATILARSPRPAPLWK